MAQVVCILGMHRSGTSLVAQLLNHVGVALGPEGLVARPAADNLRGFWEHPAFADINEALLARLGGRWDAPPTCAEGWAVDARLEDLREQARVAIAGFAGVPVWGFKDPRTAILLPFWQSLIRDPTAYVICLRSPVDVAKSLEGRNGIEASTASRLQLRYVADAVRYTDGARRLFVSYERVLADWPREVQRLAEFCGLAVDWEPVRRALTETVDAALAHHRASLEELVAHPQVAFPMKVTALAASAAFAASDARVAPETAGMPGADWFDLFASLARQAEVAEEDWGFYQREVTRLESVAAELNREKHQVQAALEARSAELAQSEAVRNRELARTNVLVAKAAGLDAELRTIRSGVAWKLLSHYRTGVDQLLPEGSRGRRWYLALIHRRPPG